MSLPFVIRRATVADAPIIARHRAAMFSDMGTLAPEARAPLIEATIAFLEPALAEERYVAWLVTALDRQNVIGGAGALLRQTFPGPIPGGRLTNGWHALVVNVYTDPDWRRSGVAEAVMRELLDWVRDRGMATVVLHASDAGRRLYERLGFTPTNEMRLVFAPTPTSGADTHLSR